MNCKKNIFLALMMMSFTSFAQLDLPKNLDVRQKTLKAFGNQAEGAQITLGGKDKSIAKSYVSFMKDEHGVNFKRRGKKGKAEEVENKQWDNEVFQLFFEVKSSGNQSELSVIVQDANGVELSKSVHSSLYAKMEQSLKAFGKSYYKEVYSDELSEARKKASKGNKALVKVNKEKASTEKKMRKSEKQINKSESKILSYQKKIKNLEKDITSQSNEIESAKKEGVALKKQVIELNSTIVEQTKNVESLKGEEKKVQEKIKAIENL